jgi:nucleoside-diphosphate-sugar epimerase
MVPIPGWMRKPVSAASWLAGRMFGGRFLTPQIVNDLFAFKFYSSDRARQELGWSPRYNFQATMERAWAFYCQEGLAK